MLKTSLFQECSKFQARCPRWGPSQIQSLYKSRRKWHISKIQWWDKCRINISIPRENRRSVRICTDTWLKPNREKLKASFLECTAGAVEGAKIWVPRAGAARVLSAALIEVHKVSLLLNVFCTNIVNILKTISLYREKYYLGSWFQQLQSITIGSSCFGSIANYGGPG